MPARDLKSSPARCEAAPVPEEPNESLPGFFFAYSTSSRMFVAGTFGFTTTT